MTPKERPHSHHSSSTTEEPSPKSLLMRRAMIVVALLIFGGGYIGSKVLEEMKKPPRQIPTYTGNKNVRVIEVRNTPQQLSVGITGRFVAAERFSLYAEVGGRVESMPFRLNEGDRFRKGDTLLLIDSREARLELASQRGTFVRSLALLIPDISIDFPERKAVWERYLTSIDVEESLPELPQVEIAKERYFLSARDIFSQFYAIRRQELALDKFAIVASFSGSVSSSTLRPGAVVRANQPLADLSGTGEIEFEASVSAEEAKFLREGNIASLTLPGGKRQGSVRRISTQIDPATQTVKVYIGVQGNGFKDGQYAEGTIDVGSIRAAYELPRKLLRSDNTVFVVSDSLLRPVAVRPLLRNIHSVIVEGIPEGAWLMAEPLPGARAGLQVIPTAEGGNQ